MPAVMNSGVRVHYEIEGSGPPLILQHGWTGSLDYWRDFGYCQPLRNTHQLILIDARGHGQSSIPQRDEDYTMQLMASDVLAVLDSLALERAKFFGYSMGGWVGFHLGIGNPHRFDSMIIGGAHPYAEDLSGLRQIADLGGSAIVGFWEAVGARLSDGVRDQLAHFPNLPLRAVVRNDVPDLSPSLQKMQMPALIYAGDQDSRYQGVKDCVRDMPNAQWVSIPGLDHLAAFVRSDLVLPHVHAFLEHHRAATRV
jgi:pimeloyl-ACP methyl ester carboxylesterase